MNAILYFGFNDLRDHKRGVENVIILQSQVPNKCVKYYIHFGENDDTYTYENLHCISIKNNILRFLHLNLIVLKLKLRFRHILVHSHNYLMSLFLLRKIELMSIHDALYYQNRSKGRRFLFVFYLIEIFVYKKTRLLHFISNFSKSQSLIQNSNRYFILPNSSHHEFNTIPDMPYGIQNQILAVRSIEERAGIEILINVAEIAQKSGDNICFLVAGKGPLLEYYRNIIIKKSLKNIKLLGYVPESDLVKLYCESKLVIVIAKYAEGFGLPIIEGYLYDKPVVASNVCAIPEVIYSKEYLFDNDPNNILEKINFALRTNNPGFRIYYFNKFSFSNIQTKLTEVYQSFQKC